MLYIFTKFAKSKKGSFHHHNNHFQSAILLCRSTEFVHMGSTDKDAEHIPNTTNNMVDEHYIRLV